MMKKIAVLLGIVWVGFVEVGFAGDVPKVIAEGEWSKPVTDSRRYALRGRLVLGERPAQDNRREVVVYVELQDASEFVGGTVRLFCDFGRSDFRPENKSGLNCELRDKERNLVPSKSFPFSGRVPKSEWVTLPSDGTIRLRATPFGIARHNAISICPHLMALWVIEENDPGEYFLSGTFAIDPRGDNVPPGDPHIWRGTLDLPAVRISNHRP